MAAVAPATGNAQASEHSAEPTSLKSLYGLWRFETRPSSLDDLYKYGEIERAKESTITVHVAQCPGETAGEIWRHYFIYTGDARKQSAEFAVKTLPSSNGQKSLDCDTSTLWQLGRGATQKATLSLFLDDGPNAQTGWAVESQAIANRGMLFSALHLKLKEQRQKGQINDADLWMLYALDSAQSLLAYQGVFHLDQVWAQKSKGEIETWVVGRKGFAAQKYAFRPVSLTRLAGYQIADTGIEPEGGE